jgi:uncharacterized protein (DUF58 family)
MKLGALPYRYTPPWRSSMSGEAVSLGSRHVYMLPTRNGFIFSLLLFVLLLAAINYENGLIYALTFWLAAVGMTSMLHTHRNLLGLKIVAGPVQPVFAGDRAVFSVCLINELDIPRLGITVAHKKNEIGRVDIGAGDRMCLPLPVETNTRGYLDMPPVVLSTQFPVGLLYTWSRQVKVEHRCVIYPQPGPYRPIVGGIDRELRRDTGQKGEGDDFIGLREYQHGDSPRHVDWKAAARGLGLHTKRFGGESRSTVWLDWEALDGLDAETRLSQLCRWVLDAEKEGMIYGLRLPGTDINPASGEAHRRSCLEALALFED